MKLKRTVQFIEYSNMALLAGLLIGVFIFVSKAKDHKFIILEMLIVFPFLIAFVFRKLIVKKQMKNSPYPGAFYSILDKLGLTHNLEIELTDALLNEIYKPHYSTAQFLKDNNLKTEIGRKRFKLTYFILMIVIGVGMFIYFNQKFEFQEKPLIFIVLSLFIVSILSILIKSRNMNNDNEPVVFFKEAGLEFPSLKIIWKDIYDWSFVIGSRNESSTIEVNYYATDGIKKSHNVDLSLLDIDKIDFLLLLTHFKGKFG